jgi:hypothetical protein
MKNTTLARKPKNDMHSGAGMYKPRKTASQAGDGADFAFNGQMGDGVNRETRGREHCANPQGHRVKNPDAINHGMKTFARRGNTSDQSVDRMESVGPSVTRDRMKMTIATASQGHPTHSGGTSVKRPPNPDAVYVE